MIFEALQFTPHLKGVLARVVPILGSVRDIHRPIFANGIDPKTFYALNISRKAFSFFKLAYAILLSEEVGAFAIGSCDFWIFSWEYIG